MLIINSHAADYGGIAGESDEIGGEMVNMMRSVMNGVRKGLFVVKSLRHTMIVTEMLMMVNMVSKRNFLLRNLADIVMLMMVMIVSKRNFC